MHKNKHQVPLLDDGSIDVDAWLNEITQRREGHPFKRLKQAVQLAKLVGEEKATPNGESCLHQGLVMANLLEELNVDTKTLSAAVIYSSVVYADLSLDDVRDQLGNTVAKLASGTREMDAIHVSHGRLKQSAHLATSIDNLRKMILGMVDDVRVVLIKFAERLSVLRQIAYFSDAEKRRVAKETLDIYAPLANRLGIGLFKWQLEDFAFRYLEPERYQQISKGLKERRADREELVDNFKKELEELVKKVGIKKYSLLGRAKHIYSIYKKMQRKNLPLEEIYDVTAMRVLVPSVEGCYHLLSEIHARWDHVEKEFDDYIAQPKPNGYQSIHTAVFDDQGRVIEVQIRTFDMNDDAELGVAAHWIYKEGRQKVSAYEQKIAWLRHVMDWQKEIAETDINESEAYEHIFDDRVYVFTPNGDVLDLPKGATPLDFAYAIHSEVGNRCRGAKVNDAIVQLTYQLKMGDQVEILKQKNAHPSRDWLNPQLGFITTARAKAKISHWFREQDHDQLRDEGEQFFEKESKRLHINLDRQQLLDLLKHFNVPDKDAFFTAIGRGEIRSGALEIALKTITETDIESVSKKVPTTKVAKKKKPAPSADIRITGIGNLIKHIARCCKPIPGDSIIGYVTLGHGVSIHRQDCPNVNRSSINKDRLLEVSWAGKTHERYPVDLHILAAEDKSVVKELTQYLLQEKIDLVGMNTQENKKQEAYSISLTIEIDQNQSLSQIIANIQKLADVIKVERAR